MNTVTEFHSGYALYTIDKYGNKIYACADVDYRYTLIASNATLWATKEVAEMVSRNDKKWHDYKVVRMKKEYTITTEEC